MSAGVGALDGRVAAGNKIKAQLFGLAKAQLARTNNEKKKESVIYTECALLKKEGQN